MARQAIASGIIPIYVNETTSYEVIAASVVYINETATSPPPPPPPTVVQGVSEFAVSSPFATRQVKINAY